MSEDTTLHPDQALSPAAAVVQAIDRNTRSILAMARLLSERLPLPKQEDVLVTDEGTVKRSVWTQAQSEAAYRARLGWAAEEEITPPATDRDLMDAALASARTRG
jgi:hypothetical protein